MPVHLHLPGPPLDLFVENFWSVMQHPSPWTKERILPDGGLEMIFNLGEPQRLHDRNGNGPGTVFRTCWFSGPRTRSIVIGPTPVVNLFGIRFRAWGAAAILRVPVIAVADEVVELESLLGDFATELHERLLSAKTVQQRFALAEAALRRRLRDVMEECRLAAACARRLLDDGAPGKVATVAAELGVGHRRLGRVFERVVGLSPKQIQRVGRFQRAIHQIGQAASVDWADVAYGCGYHDQSHFVHEFVEFTQLKPTEYLSRRGEYLNYVRVD